MLLVFVVHLVCKILVFAVRAVLLIVVFVVLVSILARLVCPRVIAIAVLVILHDACLLSRDEFAHFVARLVSVNRAILNGAFQAIFVFCFCAQQRENFSKKQSWPGKADHNTLTNNRRDANISLLIFCLL